MNAYERAIEEHKTVIDASAHLSADFAIVADLLTARLLAGYKVLICGNGGSAADAQHFSAELVGRFSSARRALPALALHSDTSSLTAIANDLGFEQVFARQVEAFGRANDVLVAISTSGASLNVIEAARTGRSLGLSVVALTGEGGGELRPEADHILAVPSRTVARIQEVHEILLHALAESIEAAVLADEADDCA